MSDTTPTAPPAPAGLSPELASARANWISHNLDPAKFDAAVARSATAAPTATGNPTVPADHQIAAARASWIAYGHDPAAFDAAVAGSPLAATDPGAPANPPPQTGQATLVPSPAADALAARLAAAGHSPEAIDAVMQKAGFVAVEVDDARSPEEQAYDQALGGADPSEYKISFVGRIPAGLDANGLAQLNSDARQALAAMRLPAALGSSLFEQAMDDAVRSGQLTGASRALWDNQQKYDLGRVVGQANADRAISNARILVSLIADKDPALAERMHARGIFRSARVVAQLSGQFERMEARAAMVGRRGAKS